MPLIEFECASCERRFEELLRGKERPACPSCGGRKLRRMLSAFAAPGRAPTALPCGASREETSCGSCGDPRGPGACRRE